MSVKVHEPVCMDSPQDLYFWFDHFLGDQVKDEWTIAGTGSAVVVDAQTGGIVRITTGGTDGNVERIHWGDIRSLLVTKKASMEVRSKISVTTNIAMDLALWFAWTDAVRWMYDTSAGHTNWMLRTTDGGAATTIDSGIAVNTDYHIFRIECHTHGGNHVHGYIDGTEINNSPVATNIPDGAGDFLQPYLNITTREDATKFMDVDYVVVRQER